MTLDFKNCLRIDALVNSEAFCNAIPEIESDRVKKQAPSNTFKVEDAPNFQIQIANRQLKKPLATSTLKIEFGENTITEHFVVMKNFTGPFIGLQFIRFKSVVIDMTFGLKHSPHLTR